MADCNDDNDTLDSWEDLDDSGELDRRLEEMTVKVDKRKTTNAEMQVPVLVNDSMRTVYQPQVKILQRNPEKISVNGNEARNVKPTKTLQQREAAYAEARQRIMGNLGAESAETRPTKLLKNTEVSKILNNVVRQPKGPDGTKGFVSPR